MKKFVKTVTLKKKSETGYQVEVTNRSIMYVEWRLAKIVRDNRRKEIVRKTVKKMERITG